MNAFRARHILVPIDFGDCSTAALHFAQSLALQFGSIVTVLHVDELLPPPHILAAGHGVIIEAFRQQGMELEKKFQAYVKAEAPQLTGVKRLLLNDSPGAAILSVAEEEAADLIVMGTHGRRGLKRWVIGSVAGQVLRNASVPVVTVRDESSNQIRRVLCPVNYSAVAGESLQAAIEISQRFKADLYVLHLVEPQELADSDREIERLSVWVGKEAPDSTRLRLLVLHGDPVEQLQQYVRSKEIDLMVIGAERRRFRNYTAVGSTSEAITRTGVCPVLIISRDQTIQKEERRLPAEALVGGSK